MARMEGTIKNASEIASLREGGRRLGAVLRLVAVAAEPGVTTGVLDELARTEIVKGGDKPAFLNYKPGGAKRAFPATLCVSVNDEVVHGIPGDRVLAEGDVVGLDLGLIHKGLFTDSAVTVIVGKGDNKAKELLQATKASLLAGIAAAKGGNFIGDIGAAIEPYAHKAGYGIVRELGGHGVGYEVHEMPYVPNYGRAGSGPVLQPGMVLAIEPMFTEGDEAIRLAPDQFTYVTRDGSRSAHFEHTVLITEGAPEILTQ